MVGKAMTRWVRGVGAAALAGGLFLSAGTSQAQEIQLTGPLKGAPACRHCRMYREGRFEVAPSVGFTLLDEYRRTILPGARLQYSLADWFSIGVWGAVGAVSITTDLADQIDAQAPRDARTQINVNHNGSGGKRPFADQTAKIGWVAAPQVQFAPFRGKLALFQKLFVDTDAYLHAGLAFVGISERGDCGAAGQPNCADPKSFELASRTVPAPTFGLGLNFYMNKFLSLGFEYRALPFSWNRAGFDSAGGGNNKRFPDNVVSSDDRTFKFNQMAVVSVGIALPTEPKVSP